MNVEDTAGQGSSAQPPSGDGVGWADYQAARERFFAARRRQAEIVRLDAAFAAPAREPGAATTPGGN